ncbi:MAG: hypothetical protein WDO56_20835 [Gammaproteobacteria bacterium]
MDNTLSRAGVACSIALAIVLSGCASPTKPDAMVAAPPASVHKSASDVSVSVAGGKETSKTGASQISDEAFVQALRESIEKAGLFSKVSPGAARYRLTAFIGKVDQPSFGFSMTVKMEVSYTLTDTQSNKAVWTHNVASTHTTPAGEAFAGVTRLRLATEGAAKDNITEAITNVSALNLP